MKPFPVQSSAGMNILSSLAMSSALLLSMACGSPDSAEPTDPSNTEASDSTPKQAPIGQPIAARDAPEVGDLFEVDIKDYVPNLGQSSSPLVDKASILACNINFNDSLSLTILPDRAWHTFALSPFYIQNCGDGWHWVYTRPKNMDHYHLGFEFQSTYNFCQGTPYKVGQMIGSTCANQRDANLWPRNASNMQSGSGIEFYARTYDNISKLFDLKSLRILSGPAIIKVYRTDISSWWQWELPAGTWTFPLNSTKLRYLQVYHKDFNGIFTIDDVKLDVHRL